MPLTTHRRIDVRLNASLCDKGAASACVVLWHLGTDRYLVELSYNRIDTQENRGTCY